MNTRTRRPFCRLSASALAASSLALALAATDAAAQTASAPTRVHVHVDCSGPCRANIGVTTPAPTPPRYTPRPSYSYPPGYVLVPVWYPSTYNSRYSYPSSDARNKPGRNGGPAALILGSLGLIAGSALVYGGVAANEGHGEGAPFLVAGAILAVAGLVGVGVGATNEHHHRTHTQFTGGVAMTQGGAVLSAGVVF